jgi:hypothetical protein
MNGHSSGVENSSLQMLQCPALEEEAPATKPNRVGITAALVLQASLFVLGPIRLSFAHFHQPFWEALYYFN